MIYRAKSKLKIIELQLRVRILQSLFFNVDLFTFAFNLFDGKDSIHNIFTYKNLDTE